ncbi:cytochrome P450 2A1-like [Dermacentor albipictus]|uniref:cytochrome P450 2A1-like n=1 Tax=Dermacentor albipictus TaxID=60249 RepID=UPI0038FCBCFF
MSQNDVMKKEVSNVFRGGGWQRRCFSMPCEVVNGDNDPSVAVRSVRKRTEKIDSNTVEWSGRIAAWEWSLLTASLTITLVSLLVLKTLSTKNGTTKGKRLSPGPRGVPILGYLPFVSKPYHVVFKELSEKYGPVVRLRLGCKDVVVLNGLKSIREGLTNPDLLFRPDNFIFNYFGVEGAQFGILVIEEVQCFADLLASKKGRPTLIAEELAASVVNNISALVFGRRYEAGDPEGRFVVALLRKFLRHANFFSFMDFLPAIRALATFIPSSRLRIMNHVFTELAQLLRSEVKNREGSMEEHFDRDFVDGYMRKIQENKGTNSHYNLTQTANRRTCSRSRRIDAVVGSQRAPVWEDRCHMPFTIASILEALRWRTLTPIGIQRAAGKNTYIGGYDIPAGTTVVANFWGLHNDPSQWHEPYKYDPTRFLNADGTEVIDKHPAFLPFSLGKRACPGESLVIMEVFLYVTTVLQKFRILPEEGKPPSLDVDRGVLSVANDRTIVSDEAKDVSKILEVDQLAGDNLDGAR